jgi:hypothetical protein
MPIAVFEAAVLSQMVAANHWLGESLLWGIGWPLVLLEPIMPTSEDSSSKAANLRLAILIIAPLLEVLAYSLAAYIVLSIFNRWRDKNRSG